MWGLALILLADSNRWKMISFAFGVPVVGFGVLQAMGHHDHHGDPGPEYPYLKMATRVRLLCCLHICRYRTLSEPLIVEH